MKILIGSYEEHVKRLFVILDHFNRDALYRQCNVDLDFEELSESFVIILEEIIKDTSHTIRHLINQEYEFRDYKDQLNLICDIKSIYEDELRDNKSKFAEKKCTLLFLAVSQQTPKDETERLGLLKIIKHLIQWCPDMILFPQKSTVQGKSVEERNGPTPLHAMVVKEANSVEEKQYKYIILKKMLAKANCIPDKDKLDLKSFNIKGEISKGSIMKGKTILNIAARTMDIKAIKILLSYGVPFDSYNEYKDNMYHTLIRYAVSFPDKEPRIKLTMQNIAEFLEEKEDSSRYKLKVKPKCIESETSSGLQSSTFPQMTPIEDDVEATLVKTKTNGPNPIPIQSNNSVKSYDPAKQDAPEKLWGMKNRDNLTPLQLAAKYGRLELFEFILNRKAYRLNDKGCFDDDIYDITEIDTIPVKNANDNHREEAKTEHARTKCDVHVPVLRLLGQQSSSNELTPRFVSIEVISKIISEKWNKYWILFWIWAVLHVLLMCLYSWTAVVRSKLDNPFPSIDSTSSAYETLPFLHASSIITVLYGMFCVLSQGFFYVRYIYMSRTLLFLSYAHGFMLLGLCILVDYILMYTVSPYENGVLPFAIIIGWYLSIYFLHVFERFSFFSVLIKSVLGDLFQFGVVLGALLIGFSVAMFVVMQKAQESEEDAFEEIGKTFVKMFTVMVGMGEIGVLFNARNPALAIIVFVLFVIMTTLLLLNALIAIMSNTCSKLTLSVSSKAYVQLQRLYTIIHIEYMSSYLRVPAVEETLGTRPRRILSLGPVNDGTVEDNAEAEGTMQDRMMEHVEKLFKDYLPGDRQPKKWKKPKPKPGPGNHKEKGNVLQNITTDIYETNVPVA